MLRVGVWKALLNRKGHLLIVDRGQHREHQNDWVDTTGRACRSAAPHIFQEQAAQSLLQGSLPTVPVPIPCVRDDTSWIEETCPSWSPEYSQSISNGLPGQAFRRLPLSVKVTFRVHDAAGHARFLAQALRPAGCHVVLELAAPGRGGITGSVGLLRSPDSAGCPLPE
eukprot:gene17393-biopygen5120